MKKVKPETALKMIRTYTSKQWGVLRESQMLSLFHEAATRVPAYKDFLKKNGVKASTIKTFKDFQSVPQTSKASYLRTYPMKELCWDGTLNKATLFAATSGSTGKPFYFPHEEDLAVQYSILWDMFLENAKPQKKPILVVICFGMGVWIGGMFTYQALDIASRRGKNVSIITPGINKEEILNALKDLAPDYAQTILVGYPPFLKDLLDDASLSSIELSKLNVRILSAAESFTEVFRDHMVKASDIKNLYRDTLNIYGTADIGAMAFETPSAILLRRLAANDTKLFSHIFGTTTKTPTLAQYNPLFTNFESVDGEILLTGTNTIPLIRYAVGDRGGVTTLDEVLSGPLTKEHFLKEAHKHDAPITELPFVYVYERADFSVKLYGATIFSEHVKEALQEESFLKRVTGKFSMQTRTNETHDQFLELNIELASGVASTQELEKKIVDAVVVNLLRKNSEYKNNYASIKEKIIPTIVFWPYEDPLYFKPGVKQKWVKK